MGMYRFSPTERMYEYEYTFANKLGAFVGRKMSRDSTRFIRLTIRSDNHYRNFIDGYTPSPGMRSAQRCFENELYSAWVMTQQSRPEIELAWTPHKLRIMTLDDCVVFVDLHGLMTDTLRCVLDLAYALRVHKYYDETT